MVNVYNLLLRFCLRLFARRFPVGIFSASPLPCLFVRLCVRFAGSAVRAGELEDFFFFSPLIGWVVSSYRLALPWRVIFVSVVNGLSLLVGASSRIVRSSLTGARWCSS